MEFARDTSRGAEGRGIARPVHDFLPSRACDERSADHAVAVACFCAATVVQEEKPQAHGLRFLKGEPREPGRNAERLQSTRWYRRLRCLAIWLGIRSGIAGNARSGILDQAPIRHLRAWGEGDSAQRALGLTTTECAGRRERSNALHQQYDRETLESRAC